GGALDLPRQEGEPRAQLEHGDFWAEGRLDSSHSSRITSSFRPATRRAEPFAAKGGCGMPLVRRIGTLAVTGAMLFGAACSNDDNAPTAPTTATVAGTYRATRFVVTSPLGTEDVLQEGGSVTTTFAADGT